jgi:hypothetical protein
MQKMIRQEGPGSKRDPSPEEFLDIALEFKRQWT